MNTRSLSVIAFILFVVAAILAETRLSIPGHVRENKSSGNARLPDPRLINDLDRVIQQRFFTAPNFGIRRIGPQPNPHLEYFVANTEEEKQAVANLQNQRWKVGIYLIGRRAYKNPSVKAKHGEDRLLVQYKLNDPVPVTSNIKKKDLPLPKRLKQDVDEAFERFKQVGSYDFSLGKWSYVARPVRAQETCLPCHRDFYVISKLANKKYAYRSRRVHDPIGVLVYAFDQDP